MGKIVVRFIVYAIITGMLTFQFLKSPMQPVSKFTSSSIRTERTEIGVRDYLNLNAPSQNAKIIASSKSPSIEKLKDEGILLAEIQADIKQTQAQLLEMQNESEILETNCEWLEKSNSSQKIRIQISNDF